MLTSVLTSALALFTQATEIDATAILAAQDEVTVARLAACEIDTEALGELLRLSQRDFDQNFQGGGWRPYGSRQGCEQATGELIELYRDHAPGVETDGLSILNWHAGQMFAYAGINDQAVALFERAKANDGGAWDQYANATIAFLRGDRPSAEAAREALLGFTPDSEEQAARQRFLDQNPRITMPEGFVTDPPNLPVVDRLLNCWGSSYGEAYSGNCDT